MHKYLHAFNLVPGVSYSILQKLWRYFGNWQQGWQKANEVFLAQAGLKQSSIFNLMKIKKELNVEAEFEKLSFHGISTVAHFDNQYPFLLQQIPSSPFLLYFKGKPLHEHLRCIAIVGTRIPSAYGERIAFELSENISQQGGTVVSGLAFGIDAQAHKAAVQCTKPTIAVLACGLRNVSPSLHQKLADDILKNGGSIISEYAMDTPAMKYRYLERNRIISGLSESTLVIEAKKRSGALITATHALEQNRSIFALPGDITRPQSEGCLRLIAEGAQPIINVQETMNQLGFATPPTQFEIFSEQELCLLHLLQNQPYSTEELYEKMNISLAQINATLSLLELKGAIQKNYSLQWEIALVISS